MSTQAIPQNIGQQILSTNSYSQIASTNCVSTNQVDTFYINKLCHQTRSTNPDNQLGRPDSQLQTNENCSCYLRNLIDVCSDESIHSPLQICLEYTGEATGAAVNLSHQSNIQVVNIKFNVTVTIMIYYWKLGFACRGQYGQTMTRS